MKITKRIEEAKFMLEQAHLVNDTKKIKEATFLLHQETSKALDILIRRVHDYAATSEKDDVERTEILTAWNNLVDLISD